MKLISVIDKKPEEPTVKEEKPKEINLEIPTCPITQTINHLKNIRNRTVIQYNPEDIYSIPPKEEIILSKVKNIQKSKCFKLIIKCSE